MKTDPFSFLRIFAACVTSIASLSAADLTWTGGAGLENGNWNNAANWGGTLPVTGDKLFFAGTSAPATLTNDFTSIYFNQFIFNEEAQAFILQGNEVGLSSGIINNSGVLQTLNLPIGLRGSQTFNTGTGSITVNGIIGPQNGIVRSLYKDGSGILTLTAANTYAGMTRIDAGTLVVAHDQALGAGELRFTNGGTLEASALPGATRTIANDIHFNTSGNIRDQVTNYIGGSSNITLTGKITRANGSTGITLAITNTALTTLAGEIVIVESGSHTRYIAFDVATNSNAIISGSITHGAGDDTSGYIIKAGGGTLTLSGNNTYRGKTDVEAGTLLINGSLAQTRNATTYTTVFAGAALGGQGGTIASDVIIQSGGAMSFVLQTAGSTNLNVGNLLLGGNNDLRLSLGAAFQVGDQFHLIESQNEVSGVFATINGEQFGEDNLFTLNYQNSTYTLQAFYDTDGIMVEVMAIPEPGTAMLITLSTFGLGLWRLRRNGVRQNALG